jgi:hypothetical protein
MFVILDNVFDEPTRKFFSDFDYGGGVTWYDLNHNQIIANIISLANKYIELKSAIGYEMWCNHDNSYVPSMHHDKDDFLFEQHNILAFPLCSIVYYPLIENLVDGDFYTEDIILKPKTNRLLIFSPGLPHGVRLYKGYRKAVSINPWDKIPFAHSKSR